MEGATDDICRAKLTSIFNDDASVELANGDTERGPAAWMRAMTTGLLVAARPKTEE